MSSEWPDISTPAEGYTQARCGICRASGTHSRSDVPTSHALSGWLHPVSCGYPACSRARRGALCKADRSNPPRRSDSECSVINRRRIHYTHSPASSFRVFSCTVSVSGLPFRTPPWHSNPNRELGRRTLSLKRSPVFATTTSLPAQPTRTCPQRCIGS